jgi:glutamate dehydrogenase (NAD(P)+)
MHAIHVLLIDDDPIQAHLVRAHLSRAPHRRYELSWAASLAAAAETLGRATFDVILLDLMLPDGRELEAYQRVAALAPDVPVLLLSGLEDLDTVLSVIRAGADDFLAKEDADARRIELRIHVILARRERAAE